MNTYSPKPVQLTSSRPFLDLFLTAYIESALWSSLDDTRGGIPLDRNYGNDDFASETITAMESDCLEFFQLGGLGEMTNEQQKKAGHDFWLTRNHHGAGFWDGEWPTEKGIELTALAHTFKECFLHIGCQDNRLYISTFGKKTIDNNHLADTIHA